MAHSGPPETSAPPALLIVNARIATGDPRRPWADAALVRAGRIEAIGASAELRKRDRTGVRMIDARGMTLLPGSPDVVIAPGAPANLVLVDATAPTSVDSARPQEIVFQIVDGHVVRDRNAELR